MFHTRIVRETARVRWAALFVVALLLAACGGQMGEQPRCEPLEASEFFEDGRCSRHLVPNTVPRGQAEEDVLFLSGRERAEESGVSGGEEEPAPAEGEAEQGYAARFPFPVTMEVMERGRERYDIYCAPCHSYDGEGDGMVVRRGFPQPPSLHDDRLREAPPGYLYDVITNGIGRMPPYEGQTTTADRWAIVAYVQALQLSQNATADDLSAEERGELGIE